MKYLQPEEITDEMIDRMKCVLADLDCFLTNNAAKQIIEAALCDRRKGERRVCKDGLTALKDAPEPNPCPKHGYDFYPACKHCYLSALRSTITPTVPEVSEGMRREWARAVYLKHLEEQAIK